jgi:Predicted acyltransferases
MKNHIREIDFIRAVGVLSVIAIHVTGAYILTSRVAYYWNIGMRFAVPLFIILSGFVLYYVDSRKESFSLITFWIKRSKKIIIPYVIWNIIYLLYSTRHEKITSDIPAFLKVLENNILMGVGTYHLYFVLVIFQLYLIYPLIRLAARKNMKLTLIVSFILTMYSQTLIYLGVQNKAAIPETVLPFYLLPPVWIFFFVFGMYISKNIKEVRRIVSQKSAASGAVWLFTYLIIIIDTKLSNTVESSIKPSVIVYSVISFIFIYGMALKMANTHSIAGKFMDFLSEQSFLIYLSHVLFLKLITSISYIAGFGEFWETSRHQLLLYIATIAASCTFAYLMSFTPLTGLIGGAHKRHLFHNNIDCKAHKRKYIGFTN